MHSTAADVSDAVDAPSIPASSLLRHTFAWLGAAMVATGVVVACGNDERPASDPTRASFAGSESDVPKTEAVVTRTPHWAKPTKTPEPVTADVPASLARAPESPSRPLTPTDQGGSESDRTITRRIRDAMMSDDGLSFTAKNAKVITQDGTVTLRGAVTTGTERTSIEVTAKNVAGVTRVDNQLEIAP